MSWFGWFYGTSTIVGYLMPNPFLYIYIIYIWFGLVGFYGTSTIVGYLMPNPFYTYISNIYELVWLVLWHINHCGLFNAKSIFIHIYHIYVIWFGWVLWHINHCGLFNAKSFLYIYIKYIWFGLVGFYGTSTIVGYLMPNPFLYIYIKYIRFGLVGFYGTSTIVGYLMPNPFYTYILNIYDLVRLGFMAYQTL